MRFRFALEAYANREGYELRYQPGRGYVFDAPTGRSATVIPFPGKGKGPR